MTAVQAKGRHYQEIESLLQVLADLDSKANEIRQSRATILRRLSDFALFQKGDRVRSIKGKIYKITNVSASVRDDGLHYAYFALQERRPEKFYGKEYRLLAGRDGLERI